MCVRGNTGDSTGCTAQLQRTIFWELRRSFFLERFQTLFHFRAGEAEHFERSRRIKRGSSQPKSAVQGVLGPADRALCHICQFGCNLQRCLL